MELRGQGGNSYAHPRVFSLSGSFSRTELYQAASGLLTLVGIFVALREAFPEAISDLGFRCLVYALYPLWGIALGKRSRDFGTTFTYGMLIGMVFPVIGVVFLYQEGEKYRRSQAAQAAAPGGESSGHPR